MELWHHAVNVFVLIIFIIINIILLRLTLTFYLNDQQAVYDCHW